MDERTIPSSGVVDVTEVSAWARRVGSAGDALGAVPAGVEECRAEAAACVDLIAALETLTAAAAGLQARLAVRLDDATRTVQAAEGLAPARLGQGVASQVGLARCESPNKGAVLLGAAKTWVREMPATLACLESGRLNEWRAMIVARETACLSVEDRAAVDARIPGLLAEHPGMGNRALEAAVKREAYRLDAQSYVHRADKAAKDRRVTCRPTAEGMVYLTALLPLRAGVGVYAALRREADAARAGGDPLGRGQLMADLLVSRVTGRPADDPADVHLDVVISDAALLAETDEPAQVSGVGTVPAAWVRALVGRLDPASQEAVAVRRLYAAPGRLVAAESSGRFFSPGLADLIRARDQRCRTPWCDAPIRHTDHVVDHAAGGPTALANGQGLCERCNHTKALPGWSARAGGGPCAEVTTATPTGHRYVSTPPPGPVTERAGPVTSTGSGDRLVAGLLPARLAGDRCG